MEINHLKINSKYSEEFDHMFHKLRFLRDRIAHGEFDRKIFHRFYIDIKEFSYIFDKIMHNEDINPELSMRIREIIDRLEQLNHKLRLH